MLTGESVKPSARVVATHGERITAVGPTAETEPLAGARTRRVDLHGRAVILGFNDAHADFEASPHGLILQFETMERTWEETSTAIEQSVRQIRADRRVFGFIGHDVFLTGQVICSSFDRQRRLMNHADISQ